MADALTIATLFPVSFIAVRIAAVARRLKGLPEEVTPLMNLGADWY
jgi:hypothetical protein